jgi:glycolate oxidase FAD binding subunit
MDSEPLWPTTGIPLGDGREAHARVQPRSVSELQDAIRDAVGAGHAVYPQGGRTSLDFGGVPGRPGLALDLTTLDRVIDYPHADMTVTVEAGITLAELDRVLGEQGQYLPLEAPYAQRATLGGIYATNTFGPRAFGWGRPRDLILGVEFVTASAERVRGGGRVVKNVAGYDFPKLLTGSLGTLGVITELTLKVRPRPEATAVVVAYASSLESVDHALEKLNVGSTRPVMLVLLNAAASATLDHGAFHSGRSNSSWCLLIGLEGFHESVAWQVDQLRSELTGLEIMADFRDRACQELHTRLMDFPGEGKAGSGTLPLVLGAMVPPSKITHIISRFDWTRWLVASDAGLGVVTAALRDRSAPATTIEDASELLEELAAHSKAATEFGGRTILLRCPTHLKSHPAGAVWGPSRPDWAIMKRLKSALDPESVFNPGRYIGGL